MLQKDDFITRLAQKGYTKREAGIIVDDFVRTLEEILASGESVAFRGFGSFEIREHIEHEVIDLKTKERITVPTYRTAKFTPGKLLKRSIKEGFLRD